MPHAWLLGVCHSGMMLGAPRFNVFPCSLFFLSLPRFKDFEGGTRVMAWASGGLIPASQRGTTLTGLIHICDWYHTFAVLAGLDPVDHKAAAHGLPPTDGGNVWPALAGYDSALCDCTVTEL